MGVAIYGRYATLSSPPVSYLAHISGSIAGVTIGEVQCFKIQGCISCVTCSYPELTEDHVLTSAYVKIFRTVTRNAVNKGV